jgi:hypothetical protein
MTGPYLSLDTGQQPSNNEAPAPADDLELACPVGPISAYDREQLERMRRFLEAIDPTRRGLACFLPWAREWLGLPPLQLVP